MLASGVAVAAQPATAIREEAGDRVATLDGVRGLAILMVLTFHFRIAAAVGMNGWADDGYLRMSAGMWAGVDLFFVLSGFLITGILLDAKATGERYFRNFYARRALRIFPAYYLFLAVIVAVLPLLGVIGDAGAREGLQGNGAWYAGYLANIRVPLEEPGAPAVAYSGHLWSLAVEEQFYLIWPALVLLLERRSLIAVCVGFVVGAPLLRIFFAAHGIDASWGYMLTPARIDVLAVGGLIAVLSRGSLDLHWLLRRAWPAGLVGLAVLVWLGVSRRLLLPYDSWVQGAGFSALAVLFGVLLLCAMTVQPGTWPHRIFSVGMLTTLGRYSYALYLIHWPVATLLAQHVQVAEWVPTVFGSSLLEVAAFSFTAGAISLGLAWASYHLWEKHFLKLKAFFPYARSAPGKA